MSNNALLQYKDDRCIGANNFYGYMTFEDCVKWTKENCNDKGILYVVFNLDSGKSEKIQK